MVNEEHKAILLKAFSVLNDEQIENFRWHLRNETPVLCGKPFCELPMKDGQGG